MKNKKIDEYVYYALIITILLLLLLTAIYEKFFSSYDEIFSCAIREKYHLYCPGCGCTRAYFALLKFNIIESLYYNCTVFYFAAISFIFIVTQTLKKIFTNFKFVMKYSNLYLYFGIIIMILNCVIRNILLIAYKIEI